jgi:hypothetical protein
MRATGQSRDARLLSALEKFRYLTTQQAAGLYFANIKDEGQRLKKASERLRKLYQRGLCYRMRIPNEYFIYSLKNTGYTHKVQHYLAIVDIWIKLIQLRPTGASIYSQVEKGQGHDIITDLHIDYRNEFKQERREYFIEVELNSSGDIREKIKKYEALAWARQDENKAPCSLCIVTNKKGLYAEIEGLEWELPVKVYPLSLAGWEW